MAHIVIPEIILVKAAMLSTTWFQQVIIPQKKKVTQMSHKKPCFGDYSSLHIDKRKCFTYVRDKPEEATECKDLQECFTETDHQTARYLVKKQQQIIFQLQKDILVKNCTTCSHFEEISKNISFRGQNPPDPCWYCIRNVVEFHEDGIGDLDEDNWEKTPN